ncbi:hypothetical protein N0V90_009505 [Kalmusia sp. IMI 367209]|nr:hypothetical protein N0V90_009505 [Kalmusia sp. IMI 367209]
MGPPSHRSSGSSDDSVNTERLQLQFDHPLDSTPPSSPSTSKSDSVVIKHSFPSYPSVSKHDAHVMLSQLLEELLFHWQYDFTKEGFEKAKEKHLGMALGPWSWKEYQAWTEDKFGLMDTLKGLLANEAAINPYTYIEHKPESNSHDWIIFETWFLCAYRCVLQASTGIVSEQSFSAICKAYDMPEIYHDYQVFLKWKTYLEDLERPRLGCTWTEKSARDYIDKKLSGKWRANLSSWSTVPDVFGSNLSLPIAHDQKGCREFLVSFMPSDPRDRYDSDDDDSELDGWPWLLDGKKQPEDESCSGTIVDRRYFSLHTEGLNGTFFGLQIGYLEVSGVAETGMCRVKTNVPVALGINQKSLECSGVFLINPNCGKSKLEGADDSFEDLFDGCAGVQVAEQWNKTGEINWQHKILDGSHVQDIDIGYCSHVEGSFPPELQPHID